MIFPAGGQQGTISGLGRSDAVKDIHRPTPAATVCVIGDASKGHRQMLRRSLVVLAAVTLAFTASACGDSGGSGGSAKEFCSLGSDKSLTENLDDPKVMAEAFEKAKDKAPDEIKGDVEILADAAGEWAEKSEGLDPTDPASLDAAAAMATPEVQEAAKNLTEFEEKNCK
jgi:hypothetical protein